MTKKDDLGPVFDYFRYCANEGIRIGIEKNLSSKFKLHYQLYHKLRLDSKFHSRYVYGALECAASKLKLYKKILKKKPHGNLTITDDKIILSYSRDIPEQKPTNFIGIDRNLNNVTTCDSKGRTIVYDLSQAQRIISSYGIVKSKFRRNDS